MRPIDGSRRSVAALAFVLLFACIGTAEAHRLKLFVTAQDGEISGHAFFVGGGRPEGVDVVVKDAGGREVFRGKTDDQGRFHWRPNVAADHAITVDAGDGHWVDGHISADMLGVVSAAAPRAAGMEPSAATVAPAAPTDTTTSPAGLCPAPIDPAALAAMVAAQVDTVVARRLRPMIEAYDQAEGRLRFNDIVGGLGMIVGLAGAGLWATARRRRAEETPHE